LEPDDLPGLAELVNELGGTDSARAVLETEKSSAFTALESTGLNSEGKALLAEYMSLMMESTSAD